MAANLEDNAANRKAKLLALRSRRDGKRKAEDEGPTDEPAAILHRNFDAATGQARKHAQDEEMDTVEQQVAGLSSKIVAEDRVKRAQDLDLLSIQPKKPNWDLKRDVEKKMAKLDGQTKAAIAQLIRKRLALEREAGKTNNPEQMDDLAAAVEQRTTGQAVSDEESD